MVANDSLKNQVLRSMSIADRDLLMPHMRRVQFELGYTFEAAGSPIKSIFFPESGLASIVARIYHEHDIEVGVAGRENMTGAAFVFGDSQSPFECMAQMPGEALAISTEDLRAATKKSPSLTAHLLKFARALSIQTAYTAQVNGHSKILPRLARWLLMLHDRVDGDDFSITHEFLSTMLGVRRQGVTEAIHIMEGRHLVISKRALITLRDRAGLVSLAGTAYGNAEREYTRVTGQPLAKSREEQPPGTQHI